jgi:lysyl-tRNA synthetase class 2
MTDSIKHFTGFDISGKSEAELFDARKEWELMDATMGKGN